MSRLAFAPILLALQIFGCSVCDDGPHQPFDSEAWKTLPWQEHHTMCQDLLESKVLEGATRERVIALLGPPNGTLKQDRISYLVRQRYILRVIGEVKVLDIRFDENGKVSTAFVRGT